MISDRMVSNRFRAHFSQEEKDLEYRHMKNFFKKMKDKVADLTATDYGHIVECFEDLREASIIYGSEVND